MTNRILPETITDEDLQYFQCRINNCRSEKAKEKYIKQLKIAKTCKETFDNSRH